MTPEDRAVRAAVPAYIAGWRSCTERTPGRRERAYAKFEGPTADDVLRRHGITFAGDRARYLRCERAIRAAVAETLREAA